MTVEYNSEVATVTFSGFLKLLIKWRGSIYKLLWQEFLIFATMYTILAVCYHSFMGADDRARFEEIVEYCSKFQENIPISFILGFYVNAVVSRWWEQFNSIPWPSRLSLIVTSHIRGQDERSRMIRRTLMRYVSLGYVMTMSSISIPVKKRFPTTNHLVESGFMLPNEHKTLEELHTPYNKYYIPFVWAATLVGLARKEGRISSEFGLQAVLDEINAYRDKAQTLFNYDWVTIPLVYTQVATIAVYMFFLSCLMSRQNIPATGTGDMIFPAFTLLQFFFYVGWLKVAEELLNPFGEDDDDFDINSLIDRNLRTSYLIVDEMHEDMPELVKDQYWDKLEINIPYTEASLQHYKEAPLGSAEGMQIPENQQQFLPEDTKLLLIEEVDETEVENKEAEKTDAEKNDGKQEADVKPRQGGQSVQGQRKSHEQIELSSPLGSVMSLASQFKEKLTSRSESNAEVSALTNQKESGAESKSRKDSKDTNKKEKTGEESKGKKDSKDITANRKESEAESKSQRDSKDTTANQKEPGAESQSQRDSKDTTANQKEKTGEESKSRKSSSPDESKTSPAAAATPEESDVVIAEKAEKLQSPPPERSDSAAQANEEENERFINNILSRIRTLQSKDE